MVLTNTISEYPLPGSPGIIVDTTPRSGRISRPYHTEFLARLNKISLPGCVAPLPDVAEIGKESWTRIVDVPVNKF